MIGVIQIRTNVQFQGANEGVKDFIQLLLEAETSEDYDSSEAKSWNMEKVHVEKKLTTTVMKFTSFTLMKV